MTGALLTIDIRGRNELSLREKWVHGPVSYLGLAIESFPNLFTITGPGSPSVLTNVIASIEQHFEWLAELLEHMGKAGVQEIEADAQAEHDWVLYNYELEQSSLVMKANSWYLGANVPGNPRVFTPFIGGLEVYRGICSGVAAQGYKGFHFKDGRRRQGHMAVEPGAIRP